MLTRATKQLNTATHLGKYSSMEDRDKTDRAKPLREKTVQFREQKKTSKNISIFNVLRMYLYNSKDQ